MPAIRNAAAIGLLVLACIAAAPSHAADPAPAAAAPPETSAERGVALSGPVHTATLTAAALAALPQVQVPAGSGLDAGKRVFEGPLLWTVLVQGGLVDPAKHQGDVRGTVLLTGQDGYTAVLALGELSPEFEGKQVIVALRMNGQPLEPGHLRIVVPGDKRGGRSVHDLARIGLDPGPPPRHGGH